MKVQHASRISATVVVFVALTFQSVNSVAQTIEIYWTETNPTRIARADSDGTNETTLVSTSHRPHALALDREGGKMYWSSYDTGVYRANIDGSQVETVLPNQKIERVEIDELHQKLFSYSVDFSVDPGGDDYILSIGS